MWQASLTRMEEISMPVPLQVSHLRNFVPFRPEALQAGQRTNSSPHRSHQRRFQPLSFQA
jgi:hypothetical protein